MHIKSAHHRPHGRQILLVLGRHMGVVDRAPALRAGGGHRHVLHVIDDCGRRSLAVTSMRRSRPTARPAGMGRTHAFREGGGLATPRAPRRLQLIAQPRVFSTQSLALSFALFQVAPESFDLFSQLFRGGLTRGLRQVLGALTHAPVMPESARQYKSDPVTKYELRNLMHLIEHVKDCMRRRNLGDGILRQRFPDLFLPVVGIPGIICSAPSLARKDTNAP
jgi:hypothetical protein